MSKIINMSFGKLAIILISIVVLVWGWAYCSALYEAKVAIPKKDIEAVENVTRVET